MYYGAAYTCIAFAEAKLENTKRLCSKTIEDNAIHLSPFFISDFATCKNP
jgi:hypothetical protein